jgi:hypothetical protein
MRALNNKSHILKICTPLILISVFGNVSCPVTPSLLPHSLKVCFLCGWLQQLSFNLSSTSRTTASYSALPLARSQSPVGLHNWMQAIFTLTTLLMQMLETPDAGIFFYTSTGRSAASATARDLDVEHFSLAPVKRDEGDVVPLKLSSSHILLSV